jgi:ABC-type molybdate transport system substrate-binding protein
MNARARPRRPSLPNLRRIFLVVLVSVIAGGAYAQAIVVSAASSLTESFQELAEAFEAQNQGVRIELNFGGSSTLATQIVQGAPVSVFASANEAQMDVVVAAGLVDGRPSVFATNRLVVIAPPGSPSRRSATSPPTASPSCWPGPRSRSARTPARP